MYAGKSLQDLAAEVTRQNNAKVDLLIDTRQTEFNLGMRDVSTGSLVPRLQVLEHDSYCMNHLAERQLGTHFNVPAKYYDMLKSNHPDLLAHTMNTLMHERPVTRMLRTLDGNARAVLSDRYRRIDNLEILETVLPVLSTARDLEIVSCEITDRRMYLKALFPNIQADVGVGDPVQSGLVISNSEVGAGAFSIEPLVYRLVCLNGMIAKDRAKRKTHVGRLNQISGEGGYEVFSDEALEADDKALLLKVRDLVRAALKQSDFEKIVADMRAAKEDKITGNPVKAVEVLANRKRLTEDHTSGILRHLIEGGDLSRYGLLNAVTRFSQDVSDYETATDYERLGGEILDLNRSQWREIADAA